MKRILLLASGLLVALPAVRSDENAGYTPEFQSFSETFTSKVLKVYSFTEGDADYVAYVVSWKGHEIVVSPADLMSPVHKYAIGDTIRCTMRRTTGLQGNEPATRIRFMVAAAQGDRPLIQPYDPAEEQSRLEAIAAEVERRREIREAAMARAAAARAKRSGEPPPEPTPAK